MTDGIELRPVGEDDLSELERLTNDPEGAGVYEWHGWHDAVRQRRQWADHGLISEHGGTLMVKNGDVAVGMVSWRRVQTRESSWCWAIGVGLGPESRGRGYGSEAQRQLVRYLFAHTPANRIEASTELDNVAEQRALERAGFTREGVLRGFGFRGGEWRDDVLYSILRNEVSLDEPAPTTRG